MDRKAHMVSVLFKGLVKQDVAWVIVLKKYVKTME